MENNLYFIGYAAQNNPFDSWCFVVAWSVKKSSNQPWLKAHVVYIFKMPQGKTKVKAKVPDLKAKNKKGKAFTRRHSEYPLFRTT